MKSAVCSGIKRLFPVLIISCIYFLFFTCVSTYPALKGKTKPVTSPSPVPAAVAAATDPGINKIENELLLVYEYKEKAMVKINEIKQLTSRIIPIIDQCKAPVNAMTPFLFTVTTIVPSVILYRRYSIRPCEYYLGDAEIAGNNANNLLIYIDSILTEVKNAEHLVNESCTGNGMSDYFKALVKNSLLSFQSNSEAEIYKIDGYINDITLFLEGYKNCINDLAKKP